MTGHPLPPSASAGIPLCVDLDGTLIRSDLLIEGILRMIRHRPLAAWRLPLWLARGKARFKGGVARAAPPPSTPPPANRELLAWLAGEKARGRHIVLVTASHELALGPVRELFDFDEILASSDSHNLKGRDKAALLVERFGEGGFDYAGDSPADEAVWKHARHAIPVAIPPRRLVALRQRYDCLHSFPAPAIPWRDQLKALRVHQWAKNLLIALPFLAGHHFHSPGQLATLVAAFLALSLCASGTYLWNDLLDLDHDRAHPRKKHRLVASGRLALPRAIGASLALVAIGLGAGFLLQPGFGSLLLGYIAATLSYSLHFKRVAIADIFLLTFLYLSRIIGGILISDARVSFWLFAFSFLLFLSLAAAKRCVELHAVADRGDGSLRGRGYLRGDLPTISGLGIASGVASGIVLSLYSNSPQVTALYQQPEWFWGICVIALYWITRIWFLTHRGLMHDDPLVFALTDRGTWLLALAGLACVLLAQPLPL